MSVSISTDGLLDEIKAMEHENKELRAQLAILKKDYSGTEGNLFNKNTKLLHRNVTLNRENADLRAEIECEERRFAVLQDQFAEVAKEKDELRAQLATSEDW